MVIAHSVADQSPRPLSRHSSAACSLKKNVSLKLKGGGNDTYCCTLYIYTLLYTSQNKRMKTERLRAGSAATLKFSRAADCPQSSHQSNCTTTHGPGIDYTEECWEWLGTPTRVPVCVSSIYTMVAFKGQLEKFFSVISFKRGRLFRVPGFDPSLAVTPAGCLLAVTSLDKVRPLHIFAWRLDPTSHATWSARIEGFHQTAYSKTGTTLKPVYLIRCCTK